MWGWSRQKEVKLDTKSLVSMRIQGKGRKILFNRCASTRFRPVAIKDGEQLMGRDSSRVKGMGVWKSSLFEILCTLGGTLNLPSIPPTKYKCKTISASGVES